MIPRDLKFWKNTQGGNLLGKCYPGPPVLCEACPCPKYMLLAFVSWSIDGPSGVADPCQQPMLEVIPYLVKDGMIYWNGKCIKLNMHSLYEDSLVARIKKCGGQWEQCVEWDQNDNCIRTETVYYDCYDTKIYRVGPCFDSEYGLRQHIFSKCPEYIGPQYPPVWNNGSVSFQAYDCIYKNWDLSQDSWYAWAYFRFIPKARFHWTKYDCNIRIDTNSQVGHEELINTYYWCNGNCLEYDANWNCINCDGTMQRQDYYQWVADANAHYIEMPAWGGSQVFSYTWPICELQQGDPECTCIDAYNIQSIAGMSEINAEIDNILDDQDNYWIGEETSAVAACFNKQYNSRFEPNQCWASWIVQGINRKWCSYAKIAIEKWDERVTARGVHIRIYAVDVKGSGDPNNTSSYPLSEQNSTTVLYDTEMDVEWGDQIDFPIVNNMINWSLANNPYCNNLGDYEIARYFPYGSACQDSQRVSINIQILYSLTHNVGE